MKNGYSNYMKTLLRNEPKIFSSLRGIDFYKFQNKNIKVLNRQKPAIELAFVIKETSRNCLYVMELYLKRM